MSGDLVVSFDTALRRIGSAEYRCTDPCHKHRGPVQYMTAVPYRGHKVAVTLDGVTYDVRIDDDPATVRMNLTEEELKKYVESKT